MERLYASARDFAGHLRSLEATVTAWPPAVDYGYVATNTEPSGDPPMFGALSDRLFARRVLTDLSGRLTRRRDSIGRGLDASEQLAIWASVRMGRRKPADLARDYSRTPRRIWDVVNTVDDLIEQILCERGRMPAALAA